MNVGNIEMMEDRIKATDTTQSSFKTSKTSMRKFLYYTVLTNMNVFLLILGQLDSYLLSLIHI